MTDYSDLILHCYVVQSVVLVEGHVTSKNSTSVGSDCFGLGYQLGYQGFPLGDIQAYHKDVFYSLT